MSAFSTQQSLPLSNLLLQVMSCENKINSSTKIHLKKRDQKIFTSTTKFFLPWTRLQIALIKTHVKNRPGDKDVKMDAIMDPLSKNEFDPVSITRGSLFTSRKVFEGVHSHVMGLLRKSEFGTLNFPFEIYDHVSKSDFGPLFNSSNFRFCSNFDSK